MPLSHDRIRKVIISSCECMLSVFFLTFTLSYTSFSDSFTQTIDEFHFRSNPPRPSRQMWVRHCVNIMRHNNNCVTSIRRDLSGAFVVMFYRPRAIISSHLQYAIGVIHTLIYAMITFITQPSSGLGGASERGDGATASLLQDDRQRVPWHRIIRAFYWLAQCITFITN